MRNVPPFSCPRCGEAASDVARCVRCDLETVDKNGDARLAPGVVFIHYRNFYGYLFPGAALVIIGWFFLSLALTFSGVAMSTSLLALVAGLGALFGLYVVRTLRRSSKHRRPLHLARARAAAVPVAAIASSDGRAHIRGRVRLVEAVRTPAGDSAAAYLLRVTEGLTGRRRAVVGVALREAMGSGRFLVEDETGAALVDDDAFIVAPLEDADVDWNTPVRIVIQDGDTVEVVGPARRSIEKVGAYRDGQPILVFDGTPAERVVIMGKPRARPA